MAHTPMLAQMQPAYARDTRCDDLPEDKRAFLDLIRFEAAACRASAHVDIYHAGTNVDLQREGAQVPTVRILLQVLEQALGKRPIFLRPGEVNLSFDENWLTSLIAAKLNKDERSVRFLIESRVSQTKRRVIASLLCAISERMVSQRI